MLEKGLGLKITAMLVFVLSMVSKIFEKPTNNRHVNHLEKYVLSSDFQFGFMSSQSNVDFLIVVSDRVARTFRGFTNHSS